MQAAEPFTLDPTADDQTLLREITDFYHRTLKTHNRAQAYLAQRGINHEEAIDRFRIGFADRSLALTFPDKRVKAGMQIRTRLEQVGILRDTGHGQFNGSVVFPVIDANGHVTELYGRKINRKLRRGTPEHTYLLRNAHNGKSPRGTWNAAALQDADEIILCHSIIEALTWWCAGHRNVTAAYGLDGFTDEHVATFQAQNIRRVLLAYGHTTQGNAASAAVAQQLDAAGIPSTRIKYPIGQDANQTATRSNNPAERLTALLSDAFNVADSLRESDPARGASGPPSAPKSTHDTPTDPAAQITDHEAIITYDDRRYRIRGLAKNTSYGRLKVNVMASRDGLLHVDTLDLYVARPRATFIKQTAAELHVEEQTVKQDLGRLLQQLEQLQADHIRQLQAKQEPPPYQMTQAEEQAARELLESPNLIERITADFAACGVVGEQTNLLVGYLAATSRKLSDPLAAVVQSSSAAGKTSLMDAVLSFIPPEDKVRYSAVTGQSLFYMGNGQLKHKVLAIAEDGGAEQAAYALKLLQSDGELTIATTGRDGHTGRIGTQQYRVEGPTALLLTTTQIDVDEELVNRCILLTVNEDRQQTRAIHAQQRAAETLEGQLARDARHQIRQLHHNAQRLLKPLRVVNPYADRLTYVDSRTGTRREHVKFLALIRTIALLHQYQRPRKRIQARRASECVNTNPDAPIEYIEATLEDIALANRLAHEVLGRSIDDLPPQTRKLLRLVDAMAAEACHQQRIDRTTYRFTRRDVREHTGWGNTQLKVHLHRLEDLEYLIVHTGGGRGRRIEYELAFDPRAADGRPRLVGLKDADQLTACTYDSKKSGSNGKKSPPSRPQVGVKSAPSRPKKFDTTTASPNGNGHTRTKSSKTRNTPLQETADSKS